MRMPGVIVFMLALVARRTSDGVGFQFNGVILARFYVYCVRRALLRAKGGGSNVDAFLGRERGDQQPVDALAVREQEQTT